MKTIPGDVDTKTLQHKEPRQSDLGAPRGRPVVIIHFSNTESNAATVSTRQNSCDMKEFEFLLFFFFLGLMFVQTSCRNRGQCTSAPPQFWGQLVQL